MVTQKRPPIRLVDMSIGSKLALIFGGLLVVVAALGVLALVRPRAAATARELATPGG